MTLKDYIEASGYKKNWIASQLGVSSSMLSLQLAGERKFKPEQTKKLCEILSIPNLSSTNII